MKFGLYFNHSVPRPWDDGSDIAVFDNALAQVELADRLGYDYAWVVEQHFMEEASHSSAPEVFLAAASQRSSRIRLGHGVALTPPAYNHPARLAERIATLDVISHGRIDLGTGDSKTRLELEGFNIEKTERQAMSRETVEQIAHMLAMDPYPGFEGKYFSMPTRNVVPKPVQKPHPPLWIACSDDATMHLAAKLGIGVLAHSFRDADEAKHIVDDYYETFKRECVPIGHAVNPNVATMYSFFCDRDGDRAAEMARVNWGSYIYGVRHYMSYGRHTPGRTNLWNDFIRVDKELGEQPLGSEIGIGTPTEIRDRLRGLRDAGLDQAIWAHTYGKLPHEAACGSLELFAEEVMPEFKAEADEIEQRKQAELAPYIEEALERKRKLIPQLADEDIPVVEAYNRSVTFDLDAMPDGPQKDMISEVVRTKEAVFRLGL